MSVKRGLTARGARRKGSRAEIKVRNMLRSIYPTELHKNVQRVPLSGAAAVKGDVMDNNDPDSVYEVKCQETLCLADWWRQAKSQAVPARTPILVINQAYRPFYFIMEKKVFEAMASKTNFWPLHKEVRFDNNRNFMDRAAEMGVYTVAALTLDNDECVAVPRIYYLDVKRALL